MVIVKRILSMMPHRQLRLIFMSLLLLVVIVMLNNHVQGQLLQLNNTGEQVALPQTALVEHEALWQSDESRFEIYQQAGFLIESNHYQRLDKLTELQHKWPSLQLSFHLNQKFGTQLVDDIPEHIRALPLTFSELSLQLKAERLSQVEDVLIALRDLSLGLVFIKQCKVSKSEPSGLIDVQYQILLLSLSDKAAQ